MSHPQNKKPAAPSGKEALGKGIRSLLQHIDSDLKGAPVPVGERKGAPPAAIERIALSQIQVNPEQPRHDFSEQALEELTRSIKLHDVIQPITVSRISAHSYRLVSGERRLRASKAAGLKDIPAYIRQVDDEQLLELALLENLQREDLNAIEVALSLRRLMEEFRLTQEQLAERMGKERSTVSNYLRLLKLPPDIQAAVRAGKLSMGHARALISVETVDRQLYIFSLIERDQLSVRQTEALARKVAAAGTATRPEPKAAPLAPAYRKIQDNLSSHFSTKVKLSVQKNGKGNISIEFYSQEELNQILGLLSI
jgi:ParB family chromosome partitioning protein